MSGSVSISKLTPNFYTIAILILVGMVVWTDPTVFLWRDDWKYLMWYKEGQYALLRGELGSDIKPLFQYVLYTEFWACGIHFYFYQVINALLIVGSSICLYAIGLHFGKPPLSSGLMAVVYLLHPNHFINAFWISQQCELLHILFLLLSTIFFFKFISTNAISSLTWFSIFLFIQNYFFPNGTFAPLVFLIFTLWQNQSASAKSLLVASAFILLLHMGFAWITKDTFLTNLPQPGMLTDLPEKFIYFIKLLSVSFWRMIIPNYSPENSRILTFFPLIIFIIGGTVLFFRKSTAERVKKILVFCVLGLLCSSITLVMTRYKQNEIHYYYTTLHLIYLVLLFGIGLDIALMHYRRLTMVMVVLIFLAFLIGDYKGRQIFASRNIQNKKQMNHALTHDLPYVPFDDPALAWEDYIIVNGHKSYVSAPILYRYLNGE